MNSQGKVSNKARKRYVRQCYKRTPLFAVQMVQEKFGVAYDHDWMQKDLVLKRKVKFSKTKQKRDFRWLQMEKIVQKFSFVDIDSSEYNRLVHQFCNYLESWKKKECIKLWFPKKEGTICVGLYWKTSEREVKEIARIAAESKNQEEFDQAIDMLDNNKYRLST